MAVVVHQPGIKVTLYKTIGRETIAGQTAASVRFRGPTRAIDLTPYLGEAGGVRTVKSVGDPAGGFSITLADRMTPDKEESLYGLTEPMDVIEIRFAHEPWKYATSGLPSNLPIQMRGFVSDVRRTEVIAPNGTPSRAVVISGQDYGKIWQIIQIFYMSNYVVGQDLLTNFRLFTNYGIGFQSNQPAGDFLRDAITSIINPFITGLASQSGLGDDGFGKPVSFVQTMTLENSVTEGVVSPFGANSFDGGTVYALLQKFCDVGVFNELFVEDREVQDGGVTVVFRPTPFRDVLGNWIQAQAIPPAFVDVPAKDIVGGDVARSDADVANYYWVDAPRYALNNSGIVRQLSAAGNEKTFFLNDYQNSAPFLYGIRKMESVTENGPNGEAFRGDGQSKKDTEAMIPNAIDWVRKRRQIMTDQNKDNVVFERGNLRLRGREDVKAGRYLRLTRGNLQWECYAAQVSHDFSPFGAFTTTVSFERGTNFIERAQRAQSPYLSELTVKGAYSG